MLKPKIYSLLIIFTFLVYSDVLFANTCPDMSSTSSAPPGWILTLGKPLRTGNQFAGATWNVAFAGIACVYNSNPNPLSTFVLVGLDSNLTPIVPGSTWYIPSTKIPCITILNQGCRCANSQYTSCSFADSSNSKK